MVVFALDCEMVGSGKKDVLARVSMVNEYGTPIYDEYVKPKAKITDYRQFVSGIKKKHLENGKNIDEVKRMVAPLLKKSILVGHTLDKDLKVLGLCHPENKRFDLAEHGPFRRNGQPVSLKKLALDHLGKNIQTGEHSSVEDAQASMELYQFAINKKVRRL